MKEFKKLETMEDLKQYEKDHPDMDEIAYLKLSIRASVLVGNLIRKKKKEATLKNKAIE
ncbi:MAG: hypothetical protein WCP85_03385 [Mariniphaga sp.]